MKFYADLHIHSYYSRATSKHLKLEYLYKWAQLKGIQVIGTGDCIHPGWLTELKEKLEPAEDGLFKLKPEFTAVTEDEIPKSCKKPVRFMLTGEISNIYKRLEKVRKVHNVIFLPDFETAEKVQARLEAIGNIRSDGRPILGLDSRDLLEIVLESNPYSFLIPAHIWTPWFSALGSKGGFDRMEDCFGDLTPHIFAVETGLSSDPPMNWRLSQLDPFILVSHSDAHSPEKLAREATIYDTEFSYTGMYRALSDPKAQGVLGTVEFFPEEGKYHYDGHRKCHSRMHPRETIRHKGLCPVCNNPVTIGVMARVEELADRHEGERPPRWRPFYSLIPLPELISETKNVGASSKKVQECFRSLLSKIGNELYILQEAEISEIETCAGTMLAEAISRMREGRVDIAAGYDGEYGRIKIFSEDERNNALGNQLELFAVSDQNGDDSENSPLPLATSKMGNKSQPIPKKSELKISDTTQLGQPTITDDIGAHAKTKQPFQSEGLSSFDSENRPDDVNWAQWQAITHHDHHLLITAGPGTGKTHTMTYRIAETAKRTDRKHILAITFTNKAAEEMRERLSKRFADTARSLDSQNTGTYQGDLDANTGTVTSFRDMESAVTDLNEALLPLTDIETQDVEHSYSEEVSDGVDDIFIGTFHSFCLHLLRQFCDRIDLPKDFAIAMPDTILSLSKTLWPNHTGSQRKTILSEISEWKSRGITENTPDYVTSYNQVLRRNKYLDFDDLLLETLVLLRQNSDLRTGIQDLYRFVFVDEYQDINAVQHALLKELVQGDVFLSAIGDPNQAIYGFRGSDNRFFRQFTTDFPEAVQLSLNENFRSAGTILQASGQVIQKIDTMDVPELTAKLYMEGAIIDHAAPTERAEAEYVVHQIEKLIGGTSMFSQDSGRVESEANAERSFGDIAVLFRLNSQKDILIEAFARSGIPFQSSGDRALIAEPGVQEILTLLHIVCNKPVAVDRAAHLLMLHVDGFGDITAESIAKMWRQETTEVTLQNITLLKRYTHSFSSKVLPGIQQFINEAHELKRVYDADGLLKALKHLGTLSGWEKLLPPQQKLREHWQRLVRLARLKSGLTEFTDYLALQHEEDTLDMGAEKVSLLTVHASKGLEFPVVFIVGCEANLLPLQREGLTTDLAEERRLFYVGMTRAKERLYFVHANRRQLFGKLIDTQPSPFLTDIEEKLKSYERRVSKQTRKKTERETKQLTLFDDF